MVDTANSGAAGFTPTGRVTKRPAALLAMLDERGESSTDDGTVRAERKRQDSKGTPQRQPRRRPSWTEGLDGGAEVEGAMEEGAHERQPRERLDSGRGTADVAEEDTSPATEAQDELSLTDSTDSAGANDYNRVSPTHQALDADEAPAAGADVKFGLHPGEYLLASVGADHTQFVREPCPANILVTTRIERTITLLAGHLQNKRSSFKMILEAPDGTETVLLTAMRERRGKNMCFVISDPSQDDGRLGKVKSNLKGTKFSISDDTCALGKARVARVEYTQRSRGAPRTMEAVIPDPGAVRKSRGDSAISLRTVEPVWNPEKSAYEMNFFGRVTEPSVKNFQLAPAGGTSDDLYLNFGKTAKDTFSCDFRRPLSAVQAFGIAMANFEVRTEKLPAFKTMATFGLLR